MFRNQKSVGYCHIKPLEGAKRPSLAEQKPRLRAGPGIWKGTSRALQSGKNPGHHSILFPSHTMPRGWPAAREADPAPGLERGPLHPCFALPWLILPLLHLRMSRNTVIAASTQGSPVWGKESVWFAGLNPVFHSQGRHKGCSEPCRQRR